MSKNINPRWPPGGHFIFLMGSKIELDLCLLDINKCAKFHDLFKAVFGVVVLWVESKVSLWMMVDRECSFKFGQDNQNHIGKVQQHYLPHSAHE